MKFLPTYWHNQQKLLVDLGFTTRLTSQVISVAFYSEHEKSDKFCSEALILASGSFTCHKSTSQDPRLYFPSEGSHTQDFYPLKNPSTPAGFEPANLGSSGEYDNHKTTEVDPDSQINLPMLYKVDWFPQHILWVLYECRSELFCVLCMVCI